MSILDKCRTRYKLDTGAISFLFLFSSAFFLVFIIFGEGLYFAITFFIIFLLMLSWHLYLSSVAMYRLPVRQLGCSLPFYCIYGLSVDEWEVIEALLRKTYNGHLFNLEMALSFDYCLLEDLTYKRNYEKRKKH